MEEADPREKRISDTARDESPGGTQVTFGYQGIRAGFLITLPVALGVAGYGIAFGLLADQAGLSLLEATLMSATVLAGASQIVAVELWANPIPVATVVLATFLVNLRYSLMGAALHPWFQHLSPGQTYGSLFFMTDENWALTLRDLKAGNNRGGFLFGSGLAIWSAWVGSTILGTLAGGAIGDPAAWGIDFILAVVFLALAVELWEDASSFIPWSVALVSAVLAAELLTGQWYILVGGVTAGIVEVLRYDE